MSPGAEEKKEGKKEKEREKERVKWPTCAKKGN